MIARVHAAHGYSVLGDRRAVGYRLDGAAPLVFASGIDFGAVVALGTVDLGAAARLRPGEAAIARIDLPYDGLPLAPGVEFALRHDTGVIGTGTIMAVAPGRSDHDHSPADW